MIKLLRRGAIERPWVIRIIMILISVAFVITMGWFGYDASSRQRVVAKVGEVSITDQQYQQAYDSNIRRYRDIFKDQFNEDLIKQLNLKNNVINNLVERQLWLMAAREMDIEVTDRELSDFILKQQAFYREGRFDPEVYHLVLARNLRISPEEFERVTREDLTVEKVRNLLKASVTVTEMELKEIQDTPVPSQAESSSISNETLRGVLLRKQAMALNTYLNGLKSKIPITIKEKML